MGISKKIRKTSQKVKYDEVGSIGCNEGSGEVIHRYLQCVLVLILPLHKGICVDIMKTLSQKEEEVMCIRVVIGLRKSQMKNAKNS